MRTRMKIRSIVIDDEPRAHCVLENYLARMADIDLCGKFLNARAALTYLQEHRVDLIFLDITMPEVDGFRFLQSLASAPCIVFTTAHPEFAFESYDYDAIDYLKKPIPFERFARAIQKVRMALQGTLRSLPNHIDLRVDGELKRFEFSKVNYFQSLGNYIKVITDERMYVTQITTKEIEGSLPRELFIRIHKSFIINRTKLQGVARDEIRISGVSLPIGKTFKKYVNAVIRGDHSASQ